MVRSFRKWKALAMLKLLEMKEKYKDDEKIVRDVNVLLSKLEHLKSRDLTSFLILVHRASANSKEFLELLPNVDEAKMWFTKGKE